MLPGLDREEVANRLADFSFATAKKQVRKYLAT